MKTFVMDSRLEASRSPTPLSDTRASFNLELLVEENNGSEGASSKPLHLN